MKTKYGILLIVVLALAACFSPWKGDVGTFSVSFGKENRSAWSLSEEVITGLKHTIKLSGGPGSEQQAENVKYGQAVNFSVLPGRWDIYVEAWLETGVNERELKAVGSRSVDIKPGKNGSINIQMGPPPISVYIVSFDSKGGSEVDSQTVAEGGTVIRPANPTRSGYGFVRWCSDETLDFEYYFDTPVTEDITLYAQWNNITYEVTFDSKGGSAVGTATVGEGGTVIRPADPTRDGYAFDDWYDDSSLSTIYDFDTLVMGDITLFANWTGNTYTVTFDKNGGDTEANPTTRTVTVPATTISALPSAPTRTGYTFFSWNTQADGDGDIFKANTPVTENITVYAKWTALYTTITFNANSGTGAMTKQTIQANTTAALTANAFTRTGYTFAGWAASAVGPAVYTDGGNYAAAASTASVTLYAVWTQNAYTVVFNENGGTGVMAEQNFAYGTSQHLTTNVFTKTGYTFAGWATTPSGDKLYNDGQEVNNLATSGTVNLYAVWTANNLTISYASGGGTGSAPTSPTSATYGNSVTIPANTYTKTGYTFAGWEVSGSGSKPGTYSAGTIKSVGELSTAIDSGNAAITLTATWTQDTYTVTFNKNTDGGGTDASPKTRTATYGNTVALPDTNPTWTGYTFDSWNTEADGSGNSFNTSTPVNGNITVYAKWKKNLTITITSGPAQPATPINTATTFGVTVSGFKNNTDAGSDVGLTVTGTNIVFKGHTYERGDVVGNERRFTVTIGAFAAGSVPSGDISVTGLTGIPDGYNYIGDPLTVIDPYRKGTSTTDFIPVYDLNFNHLSSTILSFNTYANTTEGLAKYYKLMDDVTLSSSWTPIGKYIVANNASFTGSFDGNGKTINLGSYVGVVGTSVKEAGLFGRIGQYATVKNLALTGSISITSGGSETFAGAVAGYNAGTISNVSSSVSVTVNNSSIDFCFAGGITGENYGTIKNCYSTGDVSASATGGTANSGGIAGDNFQNSSISYCWASGTISGGGSYGAYVGGIAGANNTTNATIKYCVALNYRLEQTASGTFNVSRIAYSDNGNGFVYNCGRNGLAQAYDSSWVGVSFAGSWSDSGANGLNPSNFGNSCWDDGYAYWKTPVNVMGTNDEAPWTYLPGSVPNDDRAILWFETAVNQQ